MLIVCDNVLRWLSQAYHNPPRLSWLGTAVNGALAELTTCPPKDLYYEATKLSHTLMHIHKVLGPQANYMLEGFYMSD